MIQCVVVTKGGCARRSRRAAVGRSRNLVGNLDIYLVEVPLILRKGPMSINRQSALAAVPDKVVALGRADYFWFYFSSKTLGERV